MTRRERRDAHARISARIIISLRPYREIRASRCFEILRGISLSRSSDLSTNPPQQGTMFCKTPRERPTDRAPRCTDLRKVPRRHQVDHKRRLLVHTSSGLVSSSLAGYQTCNWTSTALFGAFFAETHDAKLSRFAKSPRCRNTFEMLPFWSLGAWA